MAQKIGQDVIYRLTEQDAEVINSTLRGDGPVTGNLVQAGDLYPGKIVRTWNSDTVNLQVFLDGPDSYWAPSRKQGSRQVEYGTWTYQTED